MTAIPTVRLNRDVTIGSLAGRVGGVGLFDLEDDGDLDVLACSRDGIRAWLHGDSLEFANLYTISRDENQKN